MSEENLYVHWLDEERSDRHGLRLSLAVAIGAHLVLLAVTFPQLAAEVRAAPTEPERIFVVQTPRFERPKPPPTELPEPERIRVPIPDPTPDDPEPIVADVVEPAPVLPDFPGDVFIGFPDAPPEPDPGNTIHQVGGEVTPPVRIRYVEPRYSDMARKARIQGTVVLRAIIDGQGDVVDVEVLKSLPMGLTEEAVKAVRQWKYEPSTLGGKPVPVYFNLTVRYGLN